MISYVTGDLLVASDLDAIAHGCNCAGAMGAGIAVPIRQRWPSMYADYRRRCLAGEFGLGDVFAWRDRDLVVFNLGTQKRPGSVAMLGPIETAVTAMLAMAPGLGVRRIGVPRIGAGLGKLSWAAVRAVLERLAATTEVELVVFDRYVAGQRPHARRDKTA
jgi:O-acetyl-ADP-ribose deacetylase (regulator of RNase III)